MHGLGTHSVTDITINNHNASLSKKEKIISTFINKYVFLLNTQTNIPMRK